MKYLNRIQLAALTILLTLLAACSKSDPVVMIDDESPEMAAAMAKARAGLPEFWKIVEHPEHGESDFCLKVKITDKHGGEHFWVTEIERRDGKIMGTLNNDPDIVKSVKFGQRIEVPEPDISDWLYMREGKMYGNATIRPLFPKMPKKEVEQLKSMLAEP